MLNNILSHIMQLKDNITEGAFLLWAAMAGFLLLYALVHYSIEFYNFMFRIKKQRIGLCIVCDSEVDGRNIGSPCCFCEKGFYVEKRCHTTGGM